MSSEDKLASINDMLIIIILLFVILFLVLFLLDGFKIIDFSPGVAEDIGTGFSLDFFKSYR